MNWAYDMSGISSRVSRAKTVPMPQGPSWICERAGSQTTDSPGASTSILGERCALIWAEVRAIERARFAKLPWPVRAIGAMLDFVLRRPSP
jgi:hypothetical protein